MKGRPRMLLSVLVIGSQSPSLKSDPLYNVLTFLQFSHTIRTVARLGRCTQSPNGGR